MSLLSVTRRGSGRPFVWLHGFTHTRESARRFQSILAESVEVWTLDLPGHGTAHEVCASLPETADLIDDALGNGRFDVGGYSLGGRVALHLALQHPERVARLVVLGATRGIASTIERTARREHDEVLAAHLMEVGVDQFLDEWLAQPLFSTLDRDDDERALRSRDADGLATSLRTAGAGTQAWLGERLTSWGSPTLALAGALDQKFTMEAREIANLVLDGRAELITGAGHAAHLERPEATAASVTDFLG